MSWGSAPDGSEVYVGQFGAGGNFSYLGDAPASDGQVTVHPSTAGRDLIAYAWSWSPSGGNYSNFSNVAAGTGHGTPAAPSGLTATPYTDSTGSGVHLLWDNTSNNEDGFAIQWSADSGPDDQKTWHTLEGGDDTPTTTGADETQYDDTADHDIPAGGTIYYRVGAVSANVGGDSISWSPSIQMDLPARRLNVDVVEPDATAFRPDGRAQLSWLVVNRTGDPSNTISGNLDYSRSTAVAGQEYTPLPTAFTLPAGIVSEVFQITPVPAPPIVGHAVLAQLVPPAAGAGWILGQAAAPAVAVPAPANAWAFAYTQLLQEFTRNGRYAFAGPTGLNSFFAKELSILTTTPGLAISFNAAIPANAVTTGLIMQLRSPATVNGITIAHEIIHIRQFLGSWNGNNRGTLNADEREAWALEYLLETGATYMRSIEDQIAAGNVNGIKATWALAWGAAPVSIPSIIGLPAGTTALVGPVDLWNVNAAGRENVRFSCSALAALYNPMIAAGGLIDPATGRTLVLTVPPALAGTPFN